MTEPHPLIGRVFKENDRRADRCVQVIGIENGEAVAVNVYPSDGRWLRSHAARTRNPTRLSVARLNRPACWQPMEDTP